MLVGANPEEAALLTGEWEALEDHGAVVIAGKGPSFCAGFDLPAAIDDPSVMPLFINRLSELLRMIRRHRRPVVAAAQAQPPPPMLMR